MKSRHKAAQRIVAASVVTYPDTGATTIWIEWSNGSSTSGKPSNLHMQELLRRAAREGVRVKYGNIGES